MSRALWLAIDTATDVASVAAGTADAVVAARSVQGARQHAAQLVALIDQVLVEAKLESKGIAGIVVGDGPGSFTGLRIGWAAAKGLAQEREIQIIAVPTLMGAAHAASGGEPEPAGPVAACFDALRGQVFTAIYAFSGSRVKTLRAPVVTTLALLLKGNIRPRLAVGDGAVRYATECQEWTGRPPVGLETLPPIAGSLLALAPHQGRPAVEPEYGRPAEAQAKWEARYGRPLPNSSR